MLAQTISKLKNRLIVMVQDLIVLGLPYLDMLSIDEAFVTGSPIMAQTKNPDNAEMIRTMPSFAQDQLQSLLGIQKVVFSGYNGDCQFTKVRDHGLGSLV